MQNLIVYGNSIARSRAELLKLLRAARDGSSRDWLAILMAFAHGLRVNELCGGWRTRQVKGRKEKYFHPGIRKSDIQDGYLTVARAKGSLRTTQPLIENAEPLLNEKQAVLGIRRTTLES